MATSNQLYQNRLEHLVQIIMFTEKAHELHDEYEKIEAKFPQLARVINTIPIDYPDNFLTETTAGLCTYLKTLCEAEIKIYEKMGEVWGDDDKHNQDMYWVDYDMSIIVEEYFNRHTTKEEAYLDIIGLKQVKEAKGKLSEMVKHSVEAKKTIPADLQIFVI